MPCSVSQSLELSMKIKRALMFHKKMDYTQDTSIKSKMMSTLKKGKLLELQLMSNLENHVNVYLRNYMQKHSFIMTNKKEHF
jgi:hypothetical protein